MENDAPAFSLKKSVPGYKTRVLTHQKAQQIVIFAINQQQFFALYFHEKTLESAVIPVRCEVLKTVKAGYKAIARQSHAVF
ncbi:hypothetical protein [Polaromonas sp. CG_9.11]|uniref:hypothetical protein n=1 Tax=Polaromonas sp. CG_9.11 TaxID=2787730 RepID=UPI0018CB5577|nr:hypothetical protein [Polaromonas sp. CG_9.11]MBG6074762.1 hypothetical protein [Polaromonas sp. CG_9.11]